MNLDAGTILLGIIIVAILVVVVLPAISKIVRGLLTLVALGLVVFVIADWAGHDLSAYVPW